MNRLLKTLQWASIGMGALLLLFYFGTRFQVSASAAEEVQRFEVARRLLATPSEAAGGTVTAGLDSTDLVEPDTTLWDEGRIAKYQESLEHDFELPLGVLRISTIGLEVAVLEGTDDLTLDRALGHIEGTSRPGEPGNVAIAGHRDGFFRGLKNVAVGDRIEMETLSDRRTYSITELMVVQPDAVHVLEQTSSPTLTLVTCYPFYYAGSAPQRFIVRAQLVEEGPSSDGNTSFVSGENSATKGHIRAPNTGAGGERE